MHVHIPRGRSIRAVDHEAWPYPPCLQRRSLLPRCFGLPVRVSCSHPCNRRPLSGRLDSSRRTIVAKPKDGVGTDHFHVKISTQQLPQIFLKVATTEPWNHQWTRNAARTVLKDRGRSHLRTSNICLIHDAGIRPDQRKHTRLPMSGDSPVGWLYRHR